MALSLSLLDDTLLISAAHSVLGTSRMAFLTEICSVHSYYSATAQVRAISILGLFSRALSRLELRSNGRTPPKGDQGGIA